MTFRVFPDLYRRCKYFAYGSYGPLIGKGCYYLITCGSKYLFFIYFFIIIIIVIIIIIINIIEAMDQICRSTCTYDGVQELKSL